jgi:hypothetical protein
MPVSALLALAALNSGAAVQVQTDEFQWRRALAAGKTIEIVGINGSIDALGTGGSEVQVTAHKRGRKSNPETVRIDVVEHEDGVTICAVYPHPPRREPNECRARGKGRSNSNNNDVQVTWTIRVPEGVRFTGRTVNGEVVARRLSSEAEVHTVNGNITVETTAWATGTTVNGSIDATIGRTDWRGDAEFETVNGRITVDLPASADLEVDASTVNGSMSTDFPLTVRGKWGPRHMSGTIGQGGRFLILNTVNGGMSLKRTR